jgi:hypothetical protein
LGRPARADEPAAGSCTGVVLGRIPAKESGVTIMQTAARGDAGAALVFESKLAIDADGGRHAYRDDDKGLDTIKNACSPGRPCYGVLDRNGAHVRQHPPNDDFYVTPTALRDKTKAVDDQAAYVDSETIAYISLPKAPLVGMAKSAADANAVPLQLGDLAFVRNRKNGKSGYAIFADIGPKGKIGEGSIALAEMLGIPSSPRRGGAAGGVQFVVFLGSGNGKPRAQSDIDHDGKARLDAWGGAARLDACLAAASGKVASAGGN